MSGRQQMGSDEISMIVSRIARSVLKPALINACDAFELPRSGNKTDLAERLQLHFIRTGMPSFDNMLKAFNITRELLSVILPKSMCPTPVEPTAQPNPQSNGHIHIRPQAPSLPYQTRPPPHIPGTTMASLTQPSGPVVGPTGAALRTFNLWNDVLKWMRDFDAFQKNVESFQLRCYPVKQGEISIPVESIGAVEMRRSGLTMWARGICYDSKDTVDFVESATHMWPKSMLVSVNGFNVTTIDPPKPLKKRRDDPIDLTSFLRPGKNTVTFFIRELFGSGKEYAVGVAMSKPLSDDQMVQSVAEEEYSNCQKRVASLMHKLKSDDEEVTAATDDREVELRCPISQMEISLPARGMACTHLRCFDLKSFIFTNRHTHNYNKRWKCPICYKACRPDQCVVDTFVGKIINDPRLSKKTTRVAITPDCEWEPIGDAEDSDDQGDEDYDALENGSLKTNLNIIDLDDDVENTRDIPTQVTTAATSALPSAHSYVHATTSIPPAHSLSLTTSVPPERIEPPMKRPRFEVIDLD